MSVLTDGTRVVRSVGNVAFATAQIVQGKHVSVACSVSEIQPNNLCGKPNLKNKGGGGRTFFLMSASRVCLPGIILLRCIEECLTEM